MRNARHIAHAAAVGLVVVGLLAAATQAMALRSNAGPETTATTLDAPASKAKKKPALRLTTTTPKVTAGTTVTLRIATNTKHRRTVKVQRWDAKARTWRNVATRKVTASSTTKVKVASGTWRFRATAVKLRHSTGGKKHSHAAARSATLPLVAKTRTAPVPTKPAALTADEKTLLTAVRTARAAYAPFDSTTVDADGADSCLTAYARAHSDWMAGVGRAVEPGAKAHQAAKRATPAQACGGLTVTTVTRALGAGSAADAVALAVRAWLATPYGETDRLLSTCQEASSFRFGVAATSKDSARWLTVLVASPTSDTKKSGLC